jgi:hypothetical protein
MFVHVFFIRFFVFQETRKIDTDRRIREEGLFLKKIKVMEQQVNVGVDKPPSYDEAVKSGQYDQPFKASGSGQHVPGESGDQGQPPPPVGFYPTYGSTYTTGAPQTQVILVGGCPACRVSCSVDSHAVLTIDYRCDNEE